MGIARLNRASQPGGVRCMVPDGCTFVGGFPSAAAAVFALGQLGDAGAESDENVTILCRAIVIGAPQPV